MKKMLINIPIEQFGTPVKADLSLGKSFGHELEVKSIEYNDTYDECTITLEGFKEDIYDTVENWKLAYAVVDITDEEYEDNFISLKELFIVKKAYSPWAGSNHPVGHATIHIKYYDKVD